MLQYSPDFLLDLYARMVRIRHFEESVKFMFLEGALPGTIHQCQGQEATAVGVCSVLRNDDFITSTFRGHGHALAKGLTVEELLCELFGASTGCCKGKGGSMHVGNMAKGMVPGIAIVGGGIPVAAGMALAFKMQKTDRVAVSFFGDGAVAEGAFHESMNLASLWKLPVLFVCENNLYAMGTALRYTQAVQDLAAKGAGYGVASAAVDGMDVLAMAAAADKAADYVRQGNGPYFLECRTYRFRPHSMFDTEQYRTKEEVETWKPRDPITQLCRHMRDQGLPDEQTLTELEREVAAEVEAAVAFAEAGTWEAVEDLTRFVHSERGAS